MHYFLVKFSSSCSDTGDIICRSLNEKGTRESELIQNLGKACEKLGSEFKSLEDGVGIPDKQENARLELTLRYDAANFCGSQITRYTLFLH